MNTKSTFLKMFHKKIIFSGLSFLIVGFLICIVAFGMAHFDIKQLETAPSNKWYQTVQLNDQRFFLGLSFGEDLYITNLSIPR